MRLLLDTHIALWALVDSPSLPGRARTLLLDPAHEVFVSSATLWEIAIKRSLGKGDMPVSAGEAERLFGKAGYQPLPVTWAHAARVESLPPIHKDPFDRILVAQAMSEPMVLLTHDPSLARYSDTILRV